MKSKNKKAKLISVSLLALCFSMLAFGVYALKNATLTVQGTIGFTAHDCMVRVSATIEGDAVVNSEPNEDGTPSIERTFFAEQTLGTTSQNQTKSLNTTTSNPRIPEIYFSDLTENGAPHEILITFNISNDSFYPITATISNTMLTNTAVRATIETQSVTLDAKDGQNDEATLTVAYNLDATEVDTGVYDYVDFEDFAYSIGLNFAKYNASSQPQQQEEPTQQTAPLVQTIDVDNLPQTKSELVEFLEDFGYTVDANPEFDIPEEYQESLNDFVLATKDEKRYVFIVFDDAQSVEMFMNENFEFLEGNSSIFLGSKQCVDFAPTGQNSRYFYYYGEDSSLNTLTNVAYNQQTHVLTFNENEQATTYEVKYSNSSTEELVYEIDGSGTALPTIPATNGQYEIKVRAKRVDGQNVSCSPWSLAGIVEVIRNYSDYMLFDIPAQANFNSFADVNEWVSENIPEATLNSYSRGVDALNNSYEAFEYTYYGQGVYQRVSFSLYANSQQPQDLLNYNITNSIGSPGDRAVARVQNNFYYACFAHYYPTKTLANAGSLNTWLKSGLQGSNISEQFYADFDNYQLLNTSDYNDFYSYTLTLQEAGQLELATIYTYEDSSEATSAYNTYVTEYADANTDYETYEVIKVNDNVVAIYNVVNLANMNDYKLRHVTGTITVNSGVQATGVLKFYVNNEIFKTFNFNAGYNQTSFDFTVEDIADFEGAYFEFTLTPEANAEDMDLVVQYRYENLQEDNGVFVCESQSYGQYYSFTVKDLNANSNSNPSIPTPPAPPAP